MDQFTRDGLRFDVLDSGPADGPVVVLLHGFPQFADSWAAVTDRLTAQGFRCLAPNQRGYSPDARPKGRRPYRMPELVEDVRALVDAAGAAKVHLVGHDWGAAVAWGFALQYPDRLATLNPVSVPHPAAFLSSLVTSRQGLASWYMYAFQLPRVPERFLLGAEGRDPGRLRDFLMKTHRSRADAEKDARAIADAGALTTAINWYRALPLLNPRSTRVKVTVPTLYIWSDGDTALTRTAAERCRDWVSGPYRFETLAGVSHWIPDEEPGRTADLLVDHFAAYPV